MTSRHTPRPVPRRWFKPLLGALLALVGVLAPVESRNLPPPLDDLAGVTIASADAVTPSSVTSGHPDACPTGLRINSTDPSLCERSEPPCAEHPLQAGVYLTPSVEYPDFCEVTVDESVDAEMYLACTGLTGYAVELTATEDDQTCRLITPTDCPAGLNRVDFDSCLRVQRRSWSCPPGTLPRNQFNSCYRPPAVPSGPNPACQTGAPDLFVMPCEEYVGSDYERGTRECSSFVTGSGGYPLEQHTPNQYWCKYNASGLDVACRMAGATCAPSWAYCIKRASQTGGCDTVANTLRCRGLQAAYLNPSITVSAADVYRQGCDPCVVLPFEVVPSACPTTLRWNPRRSSNRRHGNAHTYREDYIEGSHACVINAHDNNTPMTAACLNRQRCPDPPQGRIAWQSTHHSRLAIVNSLIALRIEGIPTTSRSVPRLGATGVRFALHTDSTLRYEYPSATTGDPSVRMWRNADAGLAYTSVSDVVAGECILADLPDFRIHVEELWPDNDSADILALFGAGTLDWWTALTTTEQRQHTEARGLMYVTGMAPADLTAELDRRAGTLNEEIPCNFGSEVWCRWTPPRPGYYRLTGAGGWDSWVYGPRTWLHPAGIQAQDTFLQTSVSPGDGSCPHTSSWQDLERGQDYDCIMDHITLMGVTPLEVGLADDPVNRVFTGLIPLPADQNNEWLYSDSAGEMFRCPSRDLRVFCSSTSSAVNYTETEPVGILVQEMRVSTVVPSSP